MKILFGGILMIILASCSDLQNNFFPNDAVSKGITIKNLNWLAGTWKSVSNQGISYEIWKKENDTLLTGRGFVISNADTVFSERLKLVQRNSELFYSAAVSDQNKGRPVFFKFMEFDKGEFSFVNKDHDFPQRIIYKNPQPDFLCVRIEGTENEKLRKVDFNFLKVKN
ncbi:MAG: hypothetical protein JWO32_2589 [Bacteroidetes bacterium]|nr:hypothetical protein [Bacteroidota bacterium]